jgi:leucyl/phenylalanyl-tRNA---protein transferase
MPVFLLSDKIIFPPPHLAGSDGLLAIGGDLSRERLLLTYRMGIFPWFSDDEPIMWWSPDPRLVLYPKDIRVSKSGSTGTGVTPNPVNRNQCGQ